MQTKFVRRENSSKNSSNWASFLDFQNMSNDGRRFSATKTSPDCQRNRNNNHPSPKTSQSYPKLSKEIYIELAAFSDSIYDRGRLFKEMLSNYISRSKDFFRTCNVLPFSCTYKVKDPRYMQKIKDSRISLSRSVYFIQISNRSKVWTVEIKKDKFLT